MALVCECHWSLLLIAAVYMRRMTANGMSPAAQQQLRQQQQQQASWGPATTGTGLELQSLQPADLHRLADELAEQQQQQQQQVRS